MEMTPEGKAMWAEMIGTSDRAAAIVMAAYMENHLTKAVQTQLLQDKEAIKEMFRETGPLGSFGAKVNMGYLLKMYSEEYRNDLKRVIKIRNLFAHSTAPLTFETQQIHDLCIAITYEERAWLEHHGTPRERVAMCERRDAAKFPFWHFTDQGSVGLEHWAKYPHWGKRLP